MNILAVFMGVVNGVGGYSNWCVGGWLAGDVSGQVFDSFAVVNAGGWLIVWIV